MDIIHVASTIKGGTANSATTDPINTTGANLIVISVADYGNTAFTVSDSLGNTWTALTRRHEGNFIGTEPGTYGSRLYYCASPIVGNSHTFSISGTGIYPTIGAVAVSGAAAAPFLSESGSGHTIGPAKPGTLTPGEDGCLIVTGANLGAAGTISANGGFTALSVDYVPAGPLGSGIARLIQTTATAVDPTWSFTPDGIWASAMAVFAPAAGGGGGAPATPTGLDPVTKVTLSWSAASGATGYKLRRTDDIGTTTVYDGALLTYTDTPDAESSPTYTIAAYSGGGESAESVPVTPDNLAPGGGTTTRGLLILRVM